jgi:Mg2+-importing ATPase
VETKLIVRGAPETVLSLSKALSPAARRKLLAWVQEQGELGRRTIAIAQKRMPKTATEYTEKAERGCTFMGCISFVDPVKSTTQHAISQAKLLGVDVKILTGDGPEVARAVAVQIGLVKKGATVLTGEELDVLPEKEQLEAVRTCSVFARVSPEQKFHIIELLQKDREVGYLGEGINDAPALKIADVGIVVKGASDIAREAADIVLLNNSLGVIVSGIREGREIFANIIKYIRITLISSFGNFYSVATASLILPYLPMLPVQILLLNLLSDFPMIAIATDRVDSFELKRPRSYNVRSIIFVALTLGFISTLFDFIFFGIFYKAAPGVLQTSWFMGSVLTELVLIYSARTRYFFLRSKFPSYLLIILSGVSGVVALSLPFIPLTRELFQFVLPEKGVLCLVGLIVGCYFIATEAIKLLYYRLGRQA